MLTRVHPLPALALLLALLPLALTSPPTVFDIRDYGARGDGSSMNTQAFAKVTTGNT